VTASLSL